MLRVGEEVKSKGFVVWLTGLPCSGKTTIAKNLQLILRKCDIPSFVIDGDELRKGINDGLTFSEFDRHIAVQRASQLAKLATDQSLVAIVAMVSPTEKDRMSAAQRIGSERFVEVFVDTSLTTAIQRDVKGHYRAAMSGKISNFTGISSEYEKPHSPDIVLNTEVKSPKQSTFELLWFLQKKNFLRISWIKNKILTTLWDM